MRITINWNGYNHRRYSRPWIAKIIAWDKKPELDWGQYLGDDNGGTLEIEAQPGDIIRYGQKDGRGNSGTNAWAIIQNDGTEMDVTQGAAREHWLNRTTVNPLAQFSDDEIKAEFARRFGN
ncbi:MAG: hypothetical protein PHV74_14450 [Dehalococcoidia bacterium]|nr:hypothetical protein [Dehalococcoidia bacterium]